jgi:Asp-tRNA(Asn)/Glu-tRNA(Gln) amidotransferase A subunit family amidase
MLGMINVGERISIDEFMKALEYQNQFSKELNNLLLEYDFVISIGTSSSAPVRGIEEIDDPALLWTMGHIPAISVPLFRGPDGMPFSVQLISSRWSDYKLLYEVEKLIEMGVLPRGSAIILNKISDL